MRLGCLPLLLLMALSWQPEPVIPGDPPTASIAPRATPQPTKAARAVLRGLASFYDWHSGEAAAGPALRRFLGSSWRGTRVRVCAKGRCVTVRLSDWCQCYGVRVIDLDRASFAALASPTLGLIDVQIWKADTQ